MVSGNTGCLPLLCCNDDDDDDDGRALTAAGVNGFQGLSRAEFGAGRPAIMIEPLSHVTSLALAVNLFQRPLVLVSREMPFIDRRMRNKVQQNGPVATNGCFLLT